MIVETRIKEFEKLGFGMFVHFGLYSLLKKGEWAKHIYGISDAEYERLTQEFRPAENWAEELCATAKKAGCRYITLTARHHDGFSLYDTCGLESYDAPHSGCGRDIVREFVDACRKNDIIPFFYHTLLDWHQSSYKENFPEYLRFLRRSVELLCINYGKIGGIWFDGMWDKPTEDWEEDALYGMIRRHQPDAMIINNTGLGARGELGHIELDSVTFERGRPAPINMEGSPKYIASEMCQTLGDTWGYSENDINYKSPAMLITDLCCCRRYGSNLLLNVGPRGDGTLRPLDKELLLCVGKWTEKYDEAIRLPRPVDIQVDEGRDFLLKGNGAYYLFCYEPGMDGDGNVAFASSCRQRNFTLCETVKRITWLDNGKEASFKQENGVVSFRPVPFPYGVNLVVRVAKIETNEWKTS